MADKETVVAAMRCILNNESDILEECQKRNCPYAGTDCVVLVMEDAYKLLKPPEEEYVLRSDILKATCANCTERYVCNGTCDDTDRILAIPDAKVEPIVEAEWEERYVDGPVMFRRRFYCSACGGWQTYGKTRRCPECGAHMKVEE